MTNTIKHIGQQSFAPIYFYLVSCSSKNQVPYFILDQGCDQLKLDTSAEGEEKKMHQVVQSVTSFETYELFLFSSTVNL